MPGRYFFMLGGPLENPDDKCQEWVNSKNTTVIQEKIAESQPCPCTKEQAELDGQFTWDESLQCYMTSQETEGTKQVCCYHRSVK